MFDVTASKSSANRDPAPSVVGSSPPAWRLGRTVTRRSVDVVDARAVSPSAVAYGRLVGSYLAIDVGHRPAGRRRRRRGRRRGRARPGRHPARDVWPALHRLVRRVVAARPDDVDVLERCGVSCEGPIDAVKGTVSPLHLPRVAVLRAARAGRRADRAADGARTDRPGPRPRRAAGRAQAADIDDVMALLLSDAVEAGVICNGRLAPRPPRQRRPARPRRRRTGRAAVRLRRRPAA